MFSLYTLSVTALKRIIRNYNLHTKIANYSREKRKDVLIDHILQHMTEINGELIINPNLTKQAIPKPKERVYKETNKAKQERERMEAEEKLRREQEAIVKPRKERKKKEIIHKETKKVKRAREIQEERNAREIRKQNDEIYHKLLPYPDNDPLGLKKVFNK